MSEKKVMTILVASIMAGFVLAWLATAASDGRQVRECPDGWYDGEDACVPYRNDMQRYQTYPTQEEIDGGSDADPLGL